MTRDSLEIPPGRRTVRRFGDLALAFLCIPAVQILFPGNSILTVPTNKGLLMRLAFLFAPALILFTITAGCASIAQVPLETLRLQGSNRDLQIGDIMDTHSGMLVSFEDLIADLAVQQVVYAGETHSSINDHHIQRRILEALYDPNKSLVVAMEMFPRPVQLWLDRWSEGNLGEGPFLKEVDWEHNWGFRIELYRPLLDYCRANHIRIVALNAPPKIVKSIAQYGLDQLVPAERAEVAADFDFTNEKHRDAIRQQYEQHMAMLGGVGGFDWFYQAQLAWEETMAETLATELSVHPAPEQIVVIVGNGHIEYRFGVPSRTFRRFPHAFKTVVPIPWNTAERTLDPGLADYIWITAPEEPFHGHRGRLGVRLEPLEAGRGLKIVAVVPESPAAQAGVQPGDILIQIDDISVTGIEEVHKALMAPESGKWASHRIYLQRDGLDMQLSVDIPGNP